MTGVISGIVTPKEKAKSNTLARLQKSEPSRICGKILVFPSVIKMGKFTLQKRYQY